MSEIETNTIEEGAADELLRRHLSAELDGQLGRARTAFRREILRERALAARPTWRGGPWVLGVVGGAIAASIAFFALMPVTPVPTSSSPTNSGDPGRVVAPTFVGTNPVVQTTHSELYDGGTIVGEDGVPLRRIRRINYQKTRWHSDATGETVEQVVPSEDEILYELKTY